MGFLNLDRNLRALAFPERDDLEPGPITWLSHSGSVCTALLHKCRHPSPAHFDVCDLPTNQRRSEPKSATLPSAVR